MNSRQQLIIQLGCDYVAATIGKARFDVTVKDPAEVAARCFALAEAVADHVEQTATAESEPEAEPETCPLPLH